MITMVYYGIYFDGLAHSTIHNQSELNVIKTNKAGFHHPNYIFIFGYPLAKPTKIQQTASLSANINTYGLSAVLRLTNFINKPVKLREW